jgi:hypothetical protein
MDRSGAATPGFVALLREHLQEGGEVGVVQVAHLALVQVGTVAVVSAAEGGLAAVTQVRTITSPRSRTCSPLQLTAVSFFVRRRS